ncbi:TlpA family protein disulfide reductase [Winogradskyella haliclonae]|uniref:Thioredoxin domain-containing protein n=1 Tax=Winogradskyella haliclonae TaxID=2048558 RepID=A0ABQ2C2C2_9FLAO|nr:TlpA disulfide reductase family protein [Winogradskyella haliclonae]GGI57263.1 hypothetical protein GCM10011444_15720 [Winogradskyella haliclonae]
MNKTKRNNILFIVVIVLLILPQTRQPIQVLLHKGIALINPVTIKEETERVTLSNYDWQLKTEQETPYSFNQSKDKIVIVNFWATWCPPCIAEMPSLQKLYDKYGQDIDFLFVTNDSIDKIEAFKEKNNYTFPVYQILSNPPKELQTSSIPRTLIINPKGEIIIDKSGAVDWFGEKVKKEIDKLLEKTI